MKYSIIFISDLLVCLWILAHCEFLEALYLFTSASLRIGRESDNLDSNSYYYRKDEGYVQSAERSYHSDCRRSITQILVLKACLGPSGPPEVFRATPYHTRLKPYKLTLGTNSTSICVEFISLFSRSEDMVGARKSLAMPPHFAPTRENSRLNPTPFSGFQPTFPQYPTIQDICLISTSHTIVKLLKRFLSASG